jgi:hypothetical protein
MKSSHKESRLLKREKNERDILELEKQCLEKINKLKKGNEAYQEKLKKYEVGKDILEISPENNKLSAEEKKHLLSSGGKKFQEDAILKPEISKEISKFNTDLKVSDKKEITLPIPIKAEEKKKDPLQDKLVDIQPSDYYTSMSDNEVDKIEIAFLDNLIKDSAIFDKLEYLAHVKPISKIEFLKPQPRHSQYFACLRSR